jgi:hypothetical protein
VVDRVLEVLSHAHARGVVHGDVKPENVLVDEGTGPLEERIRITDFGLRRRIARADGAPAASASLAPSMASASVAAGAGTPDYISPEVAAGGEGDQRMDVYACGVLVFELVTGRRPSGFDLPSDLIPSLPREIDAIVKEAMRSEPARRYASADAMRLAIRDALPRRAVRHAPGLRPEVGDLFSQALAVFRVERWPLFVASALGHVLGALSLGILEAPIDAAVCLSVRDAFEGRPTRFTDRLQEAIPRTVTLVLATWFQIVFILLGLVLFVVPGLYLAARWLYVTPAIVFEGKGFRAAFRRSGELAHAGGIGRHMAIAGVLLLLGVLLSSFSWVGAAVLGPLSWGVAVAGYLRLAR